MIKKILFGLVILVLIGAAILYFWVQSKNIPIPKSTNEDPQPFVEKIYQATNKAAWDTIPFIKWSFRGEHDYVWDKQKHWVYVKWDKYEAWIKLNQAEGIVKSNEETLTGDEKTQLLKTAIDYFNNDNFWLCAHTKLEDPGTKLSIVNVDNKKGLKVSYQHGGTTPGDTYVWFIDEHGIPNKYMMWVSIIPMKGMSASWEKWITLYNGAQVSTYHDLGVFNFSLKDIKAGDNLVAIDANPNLFDILRPN